MIKKIIAVISICFLLSANVCAADVPVVSAGAAALMVADTGELIYGKNEHRQQGMASTTKIMTALLAVRHASPQRVITVTKQMAAVEGSSMGLLPGDKVTVHDLVYGMLLASGNDAANTAAIAISGSIEAFASLMNKTAQKIGMANTNFVTPSGLDAENHYSTAYDMALLGCEAIKNPDFKAACSSVQAKLCYGNEPYTRYLTNHNKLLKSFDGALGIKTGFTKKSGRCLVSAAERNGVVLVCVTLNAPNDWQDHAALLEYGFESVSAKTIELKGGKTTVFGGNKSTVSAVPAYSAEIASYCSQQAFKTEFVMVPYAVAPVKKGQVLGEVRVHLGEKTVKSVALVAAESVAATTQEVVEKPSLFSRIKAWFKNLINKLINIF